MNRIYCFLTGIIRSIRIGWPFNYPMSGHVFVDQEEHKNVKVTISKCEACNKIDITWI